MQSARMLMLAIAAFGFTACGLYSKHQGVQPITGDEALRTHGHGIYAIPVTETGRVEMPQPDTIALVAAARARTDSLEQARLAARARTDSIERAHVAALAIATRTRADSVERVSAALRIALAGLIHFDFDQAVIRPADRAALNRKAAILHANPGVRMRITGSCDERGSDKYNLALGSRRAAAAQQYLIERGIAASRLDTMSLGSASPIDARQNEAAWAMNRRTGFEITNGDHPLVTPVGGPTLR